MSINTFGVLQNRVSQIAEKFEIDMEAAWEKLHGWIDRELGLVEPTVQKIDGDLQVVAQEVKKEAVVVENKVVNTVESIQGGAAEAVQAVNEHIVEVLEASPGPAPEAVATVAPEPTPEPTPAPTELPATGG